MMSAAPTEDDGMYWPGACLKMPAVLFLQWNTPRSLNRVSGPPEVGGSSTGSGATSLYSLPGAMGL
jgi:hypothetical protein